MIQSLILTNLTHKPKFDIIYDYFLSNIRSI